ncbi:hypothetical protein BDR26DRAFT_858505 [Obelidium mucronatum]|nr:hypothetical protein BDR26DRAFT_858505 [Obelidium mucronatum]
MFAIRHKFVGTELTPKCSYRMQARIHHNMGWTSPSSLPATSSLQLLAISPISTSSDLSDLAKLVVLLGPLANSNFIPTRSTDTAIQLSSFSKIPVINATKLAINEKRGSYENYELREVARTLKEGDLIDIVYFIGHYMRDAPDKNGFAGATKSYHNFTFQPLSIHLFATESGETVPDKLIFVEKNKEMEAKIAAFKKQEDELDDDFN